MKAKLLKELRKSFKWGYKDGEWHLYTPYETTTSFHNSEFLIQRMLNYKWLYSKAIFDLSWSMLREEYKDKLELRRFKNKITQITNKIK